MSSKNRRRPRPDSGFTLIEILLAVCILATVSAIVSVSFATTTRLRDRALEDVGREHLARNALKLIAEELGLGRLHPKSRWYGLNADDEGRPADVLAFTTASHSPVGTDVREADLAHVVYTRRKDRLIRYSLRNLYALTPDAVDQTEIARHVLGFNVRYYDKRLTLWEDQWSEGPTTGMPAGVLIELTLGNPGQPERTYTAWLSTPPLTTGQKLPPLTGAPR